MHACQFAWAYHHSLYFMWALVIQSGIPEPCHYIGWSHRGVPVRDEHRQELFSLNFLAALKM